MKFSHSIATLICLIDIAFDPLIHQSQLVHLYDPTLEKCKNGIIKNAFSEGLATDSKVGRLRRKNTDSHSMQTNCQSLKLRKQEIHPRLIR